jgi:hypothetical protein
LFHLLVVIAVTVPATAHGQPASGELIERTLAIVGGQAVTLSDVRTAMALGLSDGDQAAATEQLINRTLILREVQRYAPPEPTEEAVEARLAEIRARLDNGDELDRVLAAGGFTEARLEAWLRDDLRIESYLDQRFSAVGPASDDLVADWVADLRRRTAVVELWKK